MQLQKHHLLYFGPVAVLIEWIGLGVMWRYYPNFNPNNAISTITMAPAPWPQFFGVTLTLVGITYGLFTLPLRAYSPYVPLIGLIAGIAFVLTGWIPFSGNGGVVDVVHNISSLVAVVSYTAIIALMQKHPKQRISHASKTIYYLLLFGVVLSFASLYAVHRFVALIQLFLLALIQTWTIIVVWHELKSSGATE